MNLAAILGFFVVGSLPLPASAFVAHGAEVVPLAVYSNSNAVKDQGSTSSPGTSSPSTSSSSTSPSQPQAVPAQNSSSAEAAAAQNPAKPSHLSTKKRTHAKKAIYPDCSTAPTTLNPVLTARKLAKPDSAAQSGSNLRSDSNMAGSTGSGTATGNSTRNSTQAGAAPSHSSKPCPPPKKVVRNGGADEPKIELLGGSPADQVSSARSTEQITAATEENLKKISERQLNAGQQATVSQIRQFMEQSKEAVAAGNPELAQNLATKARLLSEELLKP
ncbi:MAG: hypothetical protein WCF22_11650 [Candidatus Sulfotelmatobacter sp.]